MFSQTLVLFGALVTTIILSAHGQADTDPPLVHFHVGTSVNVPSLHKDPGDRWGAFTFPQPAKDNAVKGFVDLAEPAAFQWDFTGTYSVEAFSVSLWVPPADSMETAPTVTPTAKISVSLTGINVEAQHH